MGGRDFVFRLDEFVGEDEVCGSVGFRESSVEGEFERLRSFEIFAAENVPCHLRGILLGSLGVRNGVQ